MKFCWQALKVQWQFCVKISLGKASSSSHEQVSNDKTNLSKKKTKFSWGTQTLIYKKISLYFIHSWNWLLLRVMIWTLSGFSLPSHLASTLFLIEIDIVISKTQHKLKWKCQFSRQNSETLIEFKRKNIIMQITFRLWNFHDKCFSLSVNLILGSSNNNSFTLILLRNVQIPKCVVIYLFSALNLLSKYKNEPF